MNAKLLALLPLFAAGNAMAQDSTKAKSLDEVVVTGQYKPQTLKSSVYQVRVINQQRIQLSGATTVQQILNTQLGFRFSNDNTLGVTDVQLMGVSGRNIKILLDGVPMIDRNDARESLGQIDVNTIERIEIVEGPMSVSYGSDALAGVINIITKKTNGNSFSAFAKAQEETAGNEYYPFNHKGVHNQSFGISTGKNQWSFSLGGSHNEFDGFGGDDYGRAKSWRPKEQWLGNVKLGYTSHKFNIYYRLDGLHEDITNRGAINFTNYRAIDQKYTSKRFMHQVQSEVRFNNRVQLSSILAYTDYQRQTTTTRHDFQANTNELTTGAGEQDLSKLNSLAFKNTVQYRISSKVALQSGIDINRDEASGARIAGNPVIADYALFVSSEIKPTDKINIRPGLRFIKNSVYDAPPAIPSINTKFVLSKTLDLRAAYAYGFRSPALRELYFNFHDANHDINGNPDLKAEHSNSFNTSLTWTPAVKKDIRFSAVLGGFYNSFDDQIQIASSTVNGQTISTYFNVEHSKSAGVTLDNTINYKNLESTLGFSYIGYNDGNYEDDKNYIKEDNRNFLWTPEIAANIIYTAKKIHTRFGLFYKFTGKKPSFQFGTNSSNQAIIYVAETSSYNTADFTATTTINKYITATAGVKNIFNVTEVNNTAVSSGVHSSGGPLAMSYGRSYFLGLNFQWHKK